MKYFIDMEFIEGFREQCIRWPFKWKQNHFIDLISIGVVCEDGREYYAISEEYNYNEASDWVKENVINKIYTSMVHGDRRNYTSVKDFHKSLGRPNASIKNDLLAFFRCWQDGPLYYRAPDGIEVYGYYSDYDWVLFCSLFGKMIDLPKGFPMYCRDLKQTYDELALSLGKLKERDDYPKNLNEHNAIADANWNYELYKFLEHQKWSQSF